MNFSVRELGYVHTGKIADNELANRKKVMELLFEGSLLNR